MSSFRSSRPLLALLVLPFAAACDLVLSCEEVGCIGQLELTVTGTSDLSELSGTVTVAGETFTVDCAGTSDEEVTCSDTGVTIQLPGDVGGGDVEWSLGTPSADTGMGGGAYVGEGTVTPEWTENAPNGDGCPPVCFSGTATVELLGTP